MGNVVDAIRSLLPQSQRAKAAEANQKFFYEVIDTESVFNASTGSYAVIDVSDSGSTDRASLRPEASNPIPVRRVPTFSSEISFTGSSEPFLATYCVSYAMD